MAAATSYTRLVIGLLAALACVGLWQAWLSNVDRPSVRPVVRSPAPPLVIKSAIPAEAPQPKPSQSPSSAPGASAGASKEGDGNQDRVIGLEKIQTWRGERTVRRVQRPPEEDYWGDAGVNASSYPTYLLPIRQTPADEAIQKRYAAVEAEALRVHSYDGVLRHIADHPDPLPGWLPGRAQPILCQGLEYYSGYFSIPPQNIVPTVPNKTLDWGTVIPGKMSTYVFKQEEAYRADLVAARFAITRRRYGWATNRNLEILAAGSVPYFCGVTKIPKTGTIASLPLHAIRAAVHFPGVKAVCWPHKKALGLPIDTALFNQTLYEAFAAKVLQFTQRYQTTTHHALYVLSASSLRELPRRVLVIWASHYTIMLTGLINGLRGLGVHVTDVPRRAEIYSGPGCDEAKKKTYAKGWFFFCRTNESTPVDRTNIEARIRAKTEFDLIIISVTDTLTYNMTDPFVDIPYYSAVLTSYPRRRVIVMNDADLIRPMTDDIAHRLMAKETIYFKRETHGCNEDWR